MKSFPLHFVLVLGLVLASCQKKAAEEIDYGSVTDSVYRNAYFDFHLPIPKDWSIQDQQAQRRMTETGNQMIAGEDRNMQAMLKASEQQTVNLIAAFQHPIGSPVPFNPSVMSVAERIRHLPGIQRGKDYLFHAKKILTSGQVKVEFPKEIYSEKLGGHDFDVMEAVLHIGPSSVNQKYYAGIVKGYALTFIISSTTPEEEAAAQAALRGITFGPKL